MYKREEGLEGRWRVYLRAASGGQDEDQKFGRERVMNNEEEDK